MGDKVPNESGSIKSVSLIVLGAVPDIVGPGIMGWEGNASKESGLCS